MPMTKIFSRAEAAAACARWARDVGVPQSGAVVDAAEHAARLSHELRWDLVERLARLGAQGDRRGWAMGEGRGAWPMRTSAERLTRRRDG